jgi:hypothetical protein
MRLWHPGFTVVVLWLVQTTKLVNNGGKCQFGVCMIMDGFLRMDGRVGLKTSLILYISAVTQGVEIGSF